MKSESMPTRSNTSPVESYTEYRQKKIFNLTKDFQHILSELNQCSLKTEDKEKLRIEFLKQITKTI
jgi:predicted transcriptional regulator